jgi:NAD(P)H-flavin reductase/nitrite reductase/ring-hydroxylating ferredoxin subunit
MSNWFDVGNAREFSDGEVAPVQVDGHAIALFRLGEELFALKDLCTHGNAKLSDGYIEDGCVECPLHQGLFDIRTGAPRCAPVTEPVRSFPVRVVAGRVEVSIALADSIATTPLVQHRSARVSEIRHAASDVAILTLQFDDEPLSYKSGQYIDILLPNNVRRSYSMASPSHKEKNKLELHIRHLPGGIFTDHVFNFLQVGDSLELEGPAGDFYLRDTDAPIILLASGTGFAPIKAIVESAVAQQNQRSMHLYWGGRKQVDLYMDALCRQWAKTFSWFEYDSVLSDPDTTSDWAGRTGFVHRAVMEDIPQMQEYQVYACGAPVVVESARRDFTEQCGLPLQAFFADAFLSKADSRP